MRRKRITAFGRWLLPELFLLLITLWNSSVYGMLSLVLWTIFPLASVLLNYGIRKQISIKILVPEVASKGKQVEGEAEVLNTSFLPVGEILCPLKVRNRLTGETKEEWLELSAQPKGKTKAVYTLESGYCGYLDVSVQELYLMDWSGFLAVRCKTEGNGRISVLADTFTAGIAVEISSICTQDADNWSPDRRGTEHSEVFALRDYVQGDSLRQIHWKLSSKLNQLIVKESSLPVTKSLLLFWDKNTAEATPEEMDAMAEVVASSAQALLEQGLCFVLGWTEGTDLVQEEIEEEEDLLQAIPRMIKMGARPELSMESGEREMGAGQDSFGKIIYFARKLPEYELPFSFTDRTAVLCSEGSTSEDWRIFCYSPKTYSEDLQAAEW